MEGLFHYSSGISESTQNEQYKSILGLPPDNRRTPLRMCSLLDKTLPFEICERIKINLNFHHYNIKKIYTEGGADAPPSIIYF